MSWTLSVSAPKREFADAINAAGTEAPEMIAADQSQVDAVKAAAVALVATFAEDSGEVGLSAAGGCGASGLVTFSLSVASAADPVAPAPIDPALAEARGAVPGRYAPGERPEAPGTIDEAALAAQAAADAASPVGAAYQPNLEPSVPAAAPTSLAEDQRATAARQAAKPKGTRSS